MHSLEDHKKQVEKMILEAIVLGLENEKIKEADLPPIADYVLKYIDAIYDHHQLVVFVTNLSQKWPIFKNIEDIEKGEEKRAFEHKAAGQVLNMIKTGQATQAINYARKVVQA